jgi:hypothetical protein
MKKIVLKTIWMVCLFVCASSCSDDFLIEKRDFNKSIPSDVFSDPVQANGAYQKINAYLFERASFPMTNADPLMRQVVAEGGRQYSLTDELANTTTPANTFWDIVGDPRYNGSNHKTTKAGNHISNPPYWNQPRNNTGNSGFNKPDSRALYPMVYQLNNLIIEVDRTGRPAYPDNEFWDRLQGQAIFARAWLQFDGLRYLGGAPYYVTDKDQPEPGLESPRMPVDSMVEKICADFELAASLLPAKWDDADHGRFTSVAAWAMISRVRLYAASPVFNASWDNPSSKRWEAALNASLKAEQEAKAAGYGTSVRNIDTWDQAFYAFNGAFNPEAIITIPKSNSSTAAGSKYNIWESMIRPGVVALSTGGGIPAPDQILMKFPMADGKRPTVENGYDDQKFYRNRDPRFYKTFTFLKSQWPGIQHPNPLVLYAYRYNTEGTDYRYTDGTTDSNGAKGKSRAIVWKMSDPTVAREAESTAGTDVINYRYAEILLNIAECYAAQGKAAETVNYLTQIRNRVGAGTADLVTLSDRYSLIEAVLNERAVELAYEGNRAVDMRRWLLFEGGAGFDPRMSSTLNNSTEKYDPDDVWGLGWRLYDGQDGRDNYTKTNNVLTKLGLHRFSGERHTSKIWVYDLETTYAINPTGKNADDPTFPMPESLKNVIPITKNMTETQRNAAFDSWETFLQTTEGQKMKLIDPTELEPAARRFAMDSWRGAYVVDTKTPDWRFSFRGWYYVYPLHYDMYDATKGNTWITQTAGWMIPSKEPIDKTSEEQVGTYVYCTPE